MDGYSAYTKLTKTGTGASNETVALAGCWAHLRRRFYELHSMAVRALRHRPSQPWPGFGRLKRTSAACPGSAHDRPSGTFGRHRRRPLQALGNGIAAYLGKVKTGRGDPLRHVQTQSSRMLPHRGRVEIDSNIVERAIRPQTITRKNARFAGSDGGGRTWATIATLLQTAKMNDVDPLAWLAQTLQRIANSWPISQIEKLMPWNYKA